MNTLNNFIIERASSRNVITFLALYLLSIAALTYSDSQIAIHAPDIIKPDLRFGYDYDEILSVFSAFGDEGRRAYALNLVIDTIMPVLFAAAALFVIAGTFPGNFTWLSIAPLIFLVLDVIENISFGIMLSQFPDIHLSHVSVTSIVTQIKLSAFVVALPTLIITSIIFFYRKIRRS